MAITWVRAVWLEDDVEEEGTVPDFWIRDNSVLWPNTSNALRMMHSKRIPTSSWRRFPLIKEKLRSENRDECEALNMTCTEPEPEDVDFDEPKRKRVRKRATTLDDFYVGNEEEKETTTPPEKSRAGLSGDHSSKRSQLSDLPSPPLKRRVDLAKTPPRDLSPPNMPGGRASPTGWSSRLSPLRSPRREGASLLNSQNQGLQAPQHSSLQLPQRRSPRRSSNVVSPTRLDLQMSAQGGRASPTGWSARLSPLQSPRREGASLLNSQNQGPQAPQYSSLQLPQRRSPGRSSNVVSPTRLDLQMSAQVPPALVQSSLEENPRLGRKDGSSFPISEERFQRKVISLLAEIRMEVRELKQKIENGSSAAGVEAGIPLQTTNEDELQSLENSLAADSERSQLTRVLSRIGGANPGECARKIMMKLMTYDVMAKYSLKGRKGKHTFKNLKLYQVIADAIVQTVKCTETEAESAMSAVLKYAPDRRGGGGRAATTRQ